MKKTTRRRPPNSLPMFVSKFIASPLADQISFLSSRGNDVREAMMLTFQALPSCCQLLVLSCMGPDYFFWRCANKHSRQQTDATNLTLEILRSYIPVKGRVTTFRHAHDWLFASFKASFVENDVLRKRMSDAKNDAHCQALSRMEKRKLSYDVRSAFKAWKRSVIGNHAFRMAILRNGVYEAQDQQEFLLLTLCCLLAN